MGMKTYSKAQERRILVDNTSLLRKQTTTSHKYFVAEPRKGLENIGQKNGQNL